MLNSNENLEMIKELYPIAISVSSAGISLVTIGTIVPIVAGIFSIVYTAMKIWDFISKKRKK